MSGSLRLSGSTRWKVTLRSPTGLDSVDAGELGGEARRALGRQNLERERHIGGRDRCAIVPSRLWPQEEAHRPPVGGERDLGGDQPVCRVRLVRRAFEQALEGESPHPAAAHTLQRERIERAEGTDGGQVQRTALRRIRLDIVEVCKIGAVLQVSEEREPVGRSLALPRARSWARMMPSTTRRRWQRPERSVFY